MKLHHIGKVVKDLEEAVEYHMDTFGLKPLGEKVFDPIQKVDVMLLETGHGDTPNIELISPVGEDSPVHKFLRKAVACTTSVLKCRTSMPPPRSCGAKAP